jgi:hypothetical protein
VDDGKRQTSIDFLDERECECGRDDGQVQWRFGLVSLALLAFQRSAWEGVFTISFLPAHLLFAQRDGMLTTRLPYLALINPAVLALSDPLPTIVAGRIGQFTAWSHHILRWGWIGHILADTLLCFFFALAGSLKMAMPGPVRI